MKLVATLTALPPELKGQIKQKFKSRLSEMWIAGYWLCLDCYGINTREEDDHGQPAFCGSCKSTRLKCVPPGETVRELASLIEPGDL